MTSAASKRLRRFDNTDQPTLGGELDELLDPVLPRPLGNPDDGGADHTFAELAAAVRETFVPADDPWLGSPYAWIKQLPSVSRGRAAVTLVERWSRLNGFDVTGRRDRTHDLTAGPDRLEVKMSTLWASGEYTFQAIRSDGYDTLVLLGISPHHVHLWAPPRPLALANLQRTSGSGWITIDAARPPSWLLPWGGSLNHAHRVLTQIWPHRS